MSQAYKRLFYGTAMDVAKLCSVLDSTGIVPVVKDQTESARLAGFGTLSTDQEVWVHPDEYEKAREVLLTLEL
ncbi:MAG: putative signal transducing protein [Flavobacteriaceae bacterium]